MILEKEKPAHPDHRVRICGICGKIIRGEYYYSKTRRGTEIYVHKECWGEGGRRSR